MPDFETPWDDDFHPDTEGRCRTCVHWARSSEDPEDGWCLAFGGFSPAPARYGCSEHAERLRL